MYGTQQSRLVPSGHVLCPAGMFGAQRACLVPSGHVLTNVSHRRRIRLVPPGVICRCLLYVNYKSCIAVGEMLNFPETDKVGCSSGNSGLPLENIRAAARASPNCRSGNSELLLGQLRAAARAPPSCHSGISELPLGHFRTASRVTPGCHSGISELPLKHLPAAAAVRGCLKRAGRK